MKKMFDEFYDFPLPPATESSFVHSSNWDQVSQTGDSEASIKCFYQGAVFEHAKAILMNVEEKRLVGNAIEVKSAFWE
jgi:hypothetical protein